MSHGPAPEAAADSQRDKTEASKKGDQILKGALAAVTLVAIFVLVVFQLAAGSRRYEEGRGVDVAVSVPPRPPVYEWSAEGELEEVKLHDPGLYGTLTIRHGDNQKVVRLTKDQVVAFAVLTPHYSIQEISRDDEGNLVGHWVSYDGKRWSYDGPDEDDDIEGRTGPNLLIFVRAKVDNQHFSYEALP